jgi:N-methylhydantoinase B
MIREQVVHSRIGAIVRELAETVGRTARSKGIAEGRRYAAALLTGAPAVAAQFQHDADHVYLVRDSVAAMLDYFAFDLGDGDVVLVGDPYSGGSTPQCLTIAVPVFHDGALELIPAVRAEFADLAGEYPGVLHPLATETWQEGIRVTPVRLYRHGVLQHDVLRFLLRNSRAGALVQSDLEAIVAALHTAAAATVALLCDRGRTLVAGAIAAGIDHGRRLARAHLLRFAGIDRAATRCLTVADGTKLEIKLCVHGDAAGGLAIDAAGTSAASPLPLNMTAGHAKGYAFAAAFAELLDTVTLTDGLLDMLRLDGTAGTLLGATVPVATGLSAFVTGHLLAGVVREVLFGVGAQRIDGPAPAMVLFDPIGSTTDNPPRALSPGFATSAQGFGAPILAGSGLLLSAEVAETREGFFLVRRERDDAGRVQAIVRNRLGDLEANVLVPTDGVGSICLFADSEERALENAVAVPIPAGAILHFTYPSYAETPE